MTGKIIQHSARAAMQNQLKHFAKLPSCHEWRFLFEFTLVCSNGAACLLPFT